MNLVERVQAILLKPKETWPVIAQDGGDIASIYKNYLVILAAIPAVASGHRGLAGAALILFLGAYGVQWADRRHSRLAGLWGHALWHILTAGAFVVMYLAQVRAGG